MIGLIQRVKQASVHVAGRQVGAIDTGLLALVGVENQFIDISNPAYVPISGYCLDR